MGIPRSADRRFLERHGNKWRVVVPVPKKAQAAIGKTKLRVPLSTDSLSVANQLKWPVVADLQRKIELALRPGDFEGRALQLALMRKDALAMHGDAEPEELEIDDLLDEIGGRPIGVDPEGFPILDPAREKAAQRVADIAFGRRTPLDASRERYLSQLDVARRTKADDERAFGYLLDWCRREGVPPFREAFGRREAVRFYDFLGSDPRHPRTLNKYLVRLSLYWKWMLQRGEVASNVWEGLIIPVPHETDETEERPFTEDEMKKLLAGPAVQHMHDLMRIAALTGARLDVIVSLKVVDCKDGNFKFRAAKKEKRSRLVPIHPALEEVVSRRTRDLPDDADLFPEWPPVAQKNSLRERSFKVSQHFTTYRREVGVVDPVPNKRRDRVNFHSFRRWFITMAEQADQPESTIASVVGHARRGITFGVYSAGPKLEQARRCVEAVKLPVVPEVQIKPYKPRKIQSSKR